jgi:hypothetical protein
MDNKITNLIIAGVLLVAVLAALVVLESRKIDQTSSAYDSSVNSSVNLLVDAPLVDTHVESSVLENKAADELFSGVISENPTDQLPKDFRRFADLRQKVIRTKAEDHEYLAEINRPELIEQAKIILKSPIDAKRGLAALQQRAAILDFLELVSQKGIERSRQHAQEVLFEFISETPERYTQWTYAEKLMWTGEQVEAAAIYRRSVGAESYNRLLQGVSRTKDKRFERILLSQIGRS